MLLSSSYSLVSSHEILCNKSFLFILLHLENNDFIHWLVTLFSLKFMSNLQIYLLSTTFFSWCFTINKAFIQNFSLFCSTGTAWPCSENWFKELVSLLLCWIELLSAENMVSLLKDFFIQFINNNLTFSMPSLIVEKVCCSENMLF